jgi:hypothetical protein
MNAVFEIKYLTGGVDERIQTVESRPLFSERDKLVLSV